nr:2-dehydropantoate 2-reductase N-terminal domain-containing protein [Candidatus Hamiltonella defensa]
MKNEKLNIVICGGGRTGHLSAVLFKQRPNVKVSLLTENLLLVKHFQKNGGEIKAIRPEGSILTARPDVVSCQVEETLKDADMVIITVPAHIRPDLLKKIAPHLPSHKTVFVGAIPGFCGFDWLAEKVLNQRPNVVIWGMKDVPILLLISA